MGTNPPQDKPDPKHLGYIAEVLRALEGYPIERAALACEDAYAAITIGISAGLTMEQVVTLACQAMTETQAALRLPAEDHLHEG